MALKKGRVHTILCVCRIILTACFQPHICCLHVAFPHPDCVCFMYYGVCPVAAHAPTQTAVDKPGHVTENQNNTPLAVTTNSAH